MKKELLDNLNWLARLLYAPTGGCNEEDCKGRGFYQNSDGAYYCELHLLKE